MELLTKNISGYGKSLPVNWSVIDCKLIKDLDKIYYYVRGVMSHIPAIKSVLWLQ